MSIPEGMKSKLAKDLVSGDKVHGAGGESLTITSVGPGIGEFKGSGRSIMVELSNGETAEIPRDAKVGLRE